MNITTDALASSINRKPGVLSCIVNGLSFCFDSDCFSVASSKQEITISDEISAVFPLTCISIDLNAINQIESLSCHDHTTEYQIIADAGETVITVTIKETAA